MAVVAVLALVGVIGACGRDATGPAARSTGRQTFRVQVDGRSDDINGVFVAFFPAAVSARAGDTVEFDLPHSTGEPHTVALGELVEETLRDPARSLELPHVFPRRLPPDRRQEVNLSAARPCFLESGDPPLSETGGAPSCAPVDQPAFNGRQRLYSSGVLGEGDRFRVPLSRDIRPGRYQFTCLVHPARMSGVLTVAGDEAPVAAPAQVADAGRVELADATATLRKAMSEGGGAVAGGRARAGTGVIGKGFAAEFAPRQLAIAVGASMTWDVSTTHTISLNAGEDAVGILIRDPDGGVRVNSRALEPAGSPVPPADHAVFGSTTRQSWSIDGGSFDGTGFKSSGLLSAEPPAVVSYTLTFSRPGTYQLRCLIHPEMKAQVSVG